MYVLNNSLQAGQKINKWIKRARIGVYVGRSPSHARSVLLVLNAQTGLVSPQFHLAYDDLFETVSSPSNSYENRWKVATHFVDATGNKKETKVTKTNTIKNVPSNVPVVTLITDDVPEPMFPSDQPPVDFADIPYELQEAQGDLPAINNIVADDAPVEIPMEVPNQLRQSGRSKPSQRMLESIEQQSLVFHSVFDDINGDEEYRLQEAMQDPIAFAGKTSDPDTMYVDQALREPNRKEFIKAMVDEVNAHTEKGHWKIISRAKVPKGVKVLPAVWAMKRKRRILTCDVYKWKARLNIHGGKQEYGINYWETYAATLLWPPIRFLLTLSIINKWHSKQIDFTLAYPQADVECDLYIELPKGFMIEGDTNKEYCLQIIKNIYGQKQAGRTWALHLKAGLQQIGFEQSAVDDCIFYKQSTIFMVYVDDGIFMGPDAKHIDQCILDMRDPLKGGFDMTDEGDISDYLGIQVHQLPNGVITLTQPHLITAIIDDLKFVENTKSKDIPSLSSTILQRDEDGPAFNEHWDYWSMIGKLNFLEKSTRPDIAYAVHQCARFSANPRASHAAAIRQIVRYLIGTRDKGLVLSPTKHQFVVWCDADFAGNWNKDTSAVDIMTAKSRSGYVITYASCPVLWTSKMQTEVALSTTEAEYISLSQSLRETIPLMELFDEISKRLDSKVQTKPIVKCTVFEDNS